MRTKLSRWENQFGPLFSLSVCVFFPPLSMYCFHPDFSFHPQFWQNWDPVPSAVWGTLQITLLLLNIEPSYKIDLRELWEHLEWIAWRTIAIILFRKPQNMAPIGGQKRKKKKKKSVENNDTWQNVENFWGQHYGRIYRENLWRIHGHTLLGNHCWEQSPLDKFKGWENLSKITFSSIKPLKI